MRVAAIIQMRIQRGAPAIHPPHQPVIAPVDVSPEVARDCHRLTSPTRPETNKRFQQERCTNKRERFLASESRSHAMSFASLASTNGRTYAPRTSTCPLGLESRIQIPQHPLA